MKFVSVVRPFVVFTFFSSVLLGTSAVSVADVEKSQHLGKKVEEFTLSSHRGRSWSLSEFQDKKAVALIFLGTECPLAKLYGPRLAELYKKYEPRGVAVIGINSNTQDSVTEIAAFVDRYGIQFPMLKDLGNQVADQLEAERTPEVFLLDQDHIVRYHGRIDDQYGVGYARDRFERQDLAEAIDELLAGKPVSQPSTPAVGCVIGRVKEQVPTGDITYSNQISRIFNKRCVECHRDGEIAPFSLTSYDDVIGWEDTILEVIDQNRMPPWYANPDHGEFANDARLDNEEKELIAKWVENGMPEGDASMLPSPPEFAEGWRITKPDQVFYMRDQPFTVPAQGVVDYKHFVVDPGWDEDVYIQAAEARPGNTSVVHHILVYVLPDGVNEPDLRTVLVGYAPGSTPEQLTDGAAIKVPAGSRLLFQMHYTPNGYEQDDRSYIGVRFIDKAKVKKLVNGRLAINTRFRIPPHAAHHEVTASYQFKRDELLRTMTPHMHLRGKAFRYEASYPDGTKEILLDVPNYDFNWQLDYKLKEPKLMPKGTLLQCTAVFDNSEDNLTNPDPNKPVQWGDQSNEEMMIGFFDTLPVSDGLDDEQSRKSVNVAIDPTGTWAWQRAIGDRDKTDRLVLKLEGDRLTGHVLADGRQREIQDAVVRGDQLSFSIDAGRITLEFAATVKEEALDGTIKVSVFGQGREYPWIAKPE